MRIGRSVPPAAAPVCLRDLLPALHGWRHPREALQARTREFRDHLTVRRAFLTSSGSAALSATLRALGGISRRTEVVIPAYTCYSVPAAVLDAGMTPVLCDVNPATFDFDEAELARVVSRRTLCVLVQHPFGLLSKVARARALCRHYGAWVVEDAAQALGVDSRAGAAGTLGDVGIFSLGRGKGVTCGSGGLIVTNSDRLGDAIDRTWSSLGQPSPAYALRQLAVLVGMSVFIDPRLYWLPAALPFLKLGQTIYPTAITVKQLSGVQAGFLEHWADRLASANRARSANVAYYEQHLHLPHRPASPNCRLPILVADRQERDRLFELSRGRGLGLAIGYPTPIHRIPEIAHRFAGAQYPGAERLAACLITLPTHHRLSERDREAIVECLATSPGLRRPSHGWRKAS